jgi:uncharacterized protein YndB with AHSA1/START domain
MPVDVVTTTVINRPLREVFEFASNPDNAPKWYANIKSVEWKTSPPLQVGSQIDFVAHFLGRRMAYTYEIVAIIPDERLVMRTAQGPFPMETTYEFESESAGATRMTLRNRGTPTGFSKAAAPMMAKAVRKANIKDLASLKKQLEA